MVPTTRAARRASWCGLAVFLAAAALGRAADPTVGDPYIVLLGDRVAAADVARVAADLVYRNGGVVQHVYREGLKGFTARLPALSASGIRRDPRVTALESLTDEPPMSGEPVASTAPTHDAPEPAPMRVSGERLPFAPGAAPKLRRVMTPAADRYIVVLSERITEADGARVADRLLREFGATERGAVEAGAFRALMTETAARAMSRDASVAYIEEQSIAEPIDPARARLAPRQLPGQRLRRVAEPVRDHYRVVLGASVPEEQLESTVDELLRAYEGKRRAVQRDDPRVVVVEMSEPAARALSDDFRVEYVEERSATTRAGAR